MRIASLFLVTALLTAGCGGKSAAPAPPEPEMENAGGDTGGDTYGSKGGYEDDQEPCEDGELE